MSKTFFKIYNSPEAFFKAAKSVKQEHVIGFRHSLKEWNDFEASTGSGFSGNWEDCCRKFDRCDFKAEAALTDEIIDQVMTTDFTEMKWHFLQHLEEGDEVDVERYLAGQERCWNGVRRVPRIRKAVRIYIGFGGNCFRTAKELAVAGAVGVTFAEIMESMGIAAEIWGVHETMGTDVADNNYCDMIKLKSQNEYADIGMINFMLGNNAVFRNGLFRCWLKYAADNGVDTAVGLGTSVNLTLDMLGLTEREKKTAIMVPQLFNVDDAKKWLNDTLSDPTKLQLAARIGGEDSDL